MILADENIHSYIIKALREAGFTIISISESSKSIKDGQVIQLALQHDYLLLTEDKDFGEWVFAHHVNAGRKILHARKIQVAYGAFPMISHELPLCRRMEMANAGKEAV